MPDNPTDPAAAAVLPPPPTYHSAFGRLRHLLFGRSLPSSRAGEERLPKYLALPILSSNALSSNAYATEAILGILILKGAGALHFSVPIALGICALLIIVSLSYIQIIYAYPHGGGAYPVSKENLSVAASLVAGASLMVDYILTVAVSVAAGVAAIISVKPGWHEYILPLCYASVILITVLNLRGVKESGRTFALPTYLFILAILATVFAGLAGLWTHAPYLTAPAAHGRIASQTNLTLQAVGWYLVLQAFSQGCAALTGLEAVSNTVPIFERPQDKNAASTMRWMCVLAVLMFLGLSYLANALGVAPMNEAHPGYRSLVSMIADQAWPPALHFMFYVVQYSTAVVLLLAANTAFAGFPQLAAMMARDGFLPRQLAQVGDRLAYSNGIVVLAVIATSLLWVFKGQVAALLPMYAIGVFIGFTLAQAGMVVRGLRLRTGRWRTGIVINGLGAFCTGIVAVIIGYSKFNNGEAISPRLHFGPHVPHYGTWMVIVLVPILVGLFYKVNHHYRLLREELALDKARIAKPNHNTVLVLVSRLHRGIIEALHYGALVSNDVRAVYIEVNQETTAALKQEWEDWSEGIPLVILESPYRSLIGPLLRYIDAVQLDRSDDIVTVVVPELVVNKWWHRLLHNQTAPLLRFALFNRPDVVVTSLRYFLGR